MCGLIPLGQATTQDISGHFVTATHNGLPRETRLDSWKAIAAFFGKDERTVKRWEKERGLPVRRVPGATGGTVFAYTAELESWLAGSKEASAAKVELSATPEESPSASEEVSGAVLVAEASAPSTPPKPLRRAFPWARSLAWTLPVVAVATFLLYLSIGHRETRFSKALAAHRQPDATAQDLYLKGRFYFEKRTPGDLNTAVDAFTQAIVHDPGYAQAYVGLADTYSLLREYSTMPAVEAEQRARVAAQRAVDLDPNLAEAHSSLAFAEFWGFLDAADADREFRRAIELDPNVARAHHWYATFLIQVHRFDESLAEIERARQLDPSSKSILADKGLLLMDAGHPEEGLALLKQMEIDEPSFRSLHRYLGIVYWEGGNYKAALEEYRKDAAMRGKDDAARDIDAQQAALQSGGAQGLFQYRLGTALQAYAHDNGSAFRVASAYAYLHQRNEAMKYLELARQSHDIGLTDVELARELGCLHSDPEFRKLVTDIGMPALP
jgi:Tfp pilus assembly protein PilF